MENAEFLFITSLVVIDTAIHFRIRWPQSRRSENAERFIGRLYALNECLVVEEQHWQARVSRFRLQQHEQLTSSTLKSECFAAAIKGELENLVEAKRIRFLVES